MGPIRCVKLPILVLLTVAIVFPAVGFEQGTATLQGTLEFAKDGTPMLRTADGEVALGSGSKPLSDTLKDTRLSGRTLKVVGRTGKNSSFDVNEFFVVRGENLYRIIYYCEVCNITAFSPGNCVCCQRPTAPVEVSPTDPRIYHEEVAAPPHK